MKTTQSNLYKFENRNFCYCSIALFARYDRENQSYDRQH